MVIVHDAIDINCQSQRNFEVIIYNSWFFMKDNSSSYHQWPPQVYGHKNSCTIRMSAQSGFCRVHVHVWGLQNLPFQYKQTKKFYSPISGYALYIFLPMILFKSPLCWWVFLFQLCHNLQGRENKQSKYSTRYTELMTLEYFDCIRFTIIDLMHNLFLGTAKHLMKNVWLPNKILKQNDLKFIQELIDNMKVPSNMGRIPNKIASNFASFTSDQWKLWTVVYSEFALKKYLPSEDYKLWLLFVKASRILTAPIIAFRSLALAHSSLMEFCRKFETRYGQLEVTPNMHLHSHLRRGSTWKPYFSWIISF